MMMMMMHMLIIFMLLMKIKIEIILMIMIIEETIHENIILFFTPISKPIGHIPAVGPPKTNFPG
jgi:hypothetical protein